MAEHPKTDGHEKKGSASFLHTVWVSLEYLSVRVVEGLGSRLKVVRTHNNLFMGATLFVLGLFNWSSGKYCDGNSSDYLSCTRPVTYYYYSAFEIFLLVVGLALILIWWIENRKTR